MSCHDAKQCACEDCANDRSEQDFVPWPEDAREEATNNAGCDRGNDAARSDVREDGVSCRNPASQCDSPYQCGKEACDIAKRARLQFAA
jgi:hypothetical protein